MTADQPLVTHEHLSALRKVRDYLPSKVTGDFETDAAVALVDSFIQAAEADKPALPEGWVRYDMGEGHCRYLHHRAGGLWITDSPDSAYFGDATPLVRERLTPLVTAASLVPEDWAIHRDAQADGWDLIRNASGLVVLSRYDKPWAFDVPAALVSAAQAERGESR